MVVELNRQSIFEFKVVATSKSVVRGQDGFVPLNLLSFGFSEAGDAVFDRFLSEGGEDLVDVSVYVWFCYFVEKADSGG